jgi:hypothetical protein
VTASIHVEGARVIAAMTPPTSKAPFNRGRLILRAADGTTIRVRIYTSAGRAEGPILSIEDLRELVEAEQITELPRDKSIPAVSGASLWVLRRNLPRRDRALADLRNSGLLVHEPLDGAEDAKLCVVAEGQPGGAELLDRWRNEAVEAAKAHAERGDWDRARIDAEIAQAVCRGLDPDVLALLSLAYENCSREKRAAGILVMARRSRGEDFEAQVVRVREHLQETLTSSQSARAQPSPGLQDALREHFPIPAQSLGKSRSSRLAAA